MEKIQNILSNLGAYTQPNDVTVKRATLSKLAKRIVMAVSLSLPMMGAYGDPSTSSPAATSLVSQAQSAISSYQYAHIESHIAQLREAKLRYARIADNGGWQPVILKGAFRKGDKSDAVKTIVRRLQFEYPELANSCDGANQNTETPCEYTSRVESVVKDFQRRHGLKVDGVVGAKTLAAMNISAAQKRDKLALNIARIQRFKSKLGESFVLVNIPEYRLRFINNGEVKASKGVVVGRPSWKTPSFSDKIERFVVNPEWRIPLSIATREIAPKVAKDPDYLAKNNIVIRKDSFVDDELIDPSTIDWASIKPYQFDHFLVKLPNDKNPLGKVKYLFPNPHAVYVHDTPNQRWFNQPRRAASHGCIRLEDPFSLVEIIAEIQNGSSLVEQVSLAREMRESKTFHLDDPLPIHLVYWTAWADEKGKVNFREDIYQRDQAELNTIAQVASL